MGRGRPSKKNPIVGVFTNKDGVSEPGCVKWEMNDEVGWYFLYNGLGTEKVDGIGHVTFREIRNTYSFIQADDVKKLQGV